MLLTKHFKIQTGCVINFLLALLFLLMCRPLLTIFRRHKVGEIIPVDDHVHYHKLAGVLVMLFSVIHAVAHFVNIGMFFYKKSHNFPLSTCFSCSTGTNLQPDFHIFLYENDLNHITPKNLVGRPFPSLRFRVSLQYFFGLSDLC